MIKRRFREIEIDDSCVLYIPFYKYGLENGSVVIDHSGYNNDGTRYGARSGELGWSFDGVDDYVDLGNVNVNVLGFTINDAFSIFALAYMNVGTWFGGIIGKYDISISRGWWLAHNNYTKQFSFLLRTADNTSQELLVNANSIDGEWSTVAATYDGSGQRQGMKIYVNGEDRSIYEGYHEGATDITNTQSAKIASTTGSNAFLNGKIALILVFKKELTPQEVQNLHEQAMRLL